MPALAGLARIAAYTDPEKAARLADRAVSLASLARPEAFIAAAVALRRGDLKQATLRAKEAVEAARTRRDRPALAEALFVRARVLGERGEAVEARPLLDEAATL